MSTGSQFFQSAPAVPKPKFNLSRIPSHELLELLNNQLHLPFKEFYYLLDRHPFLKLAKSNMAILTTATKKALTNNSFEFEPISTASMLSIKRHLKDITKEVINKARQDKELEQFQERLHIVTNCFIQIYTELLTRSNEAVAEKENMRRSVLSP